MHLYAYGLLYHARGKGLHLYLYLYINKLYSLSVYIFELKYITFDIGKVQGKNRGDLIQLQQKYFFLSHKIVFKLYVNYR